MSTKSLPFGLREIGFVCLLSLFWQSSPWPVVLVANREEAYARPTSPPQVWMDADGLRWWGGRDQMAGGTWLGVNPRGMIAAVTNRRRTPVAAEPRSRGLLCLDLLRARTTSAAVSQALSQLTSGTYDGCNLLLADACEACVIEWGDDLQVTPLQPGLHLLANDRLNDPFDGRLSRVRRELRPPRPDALSDWVRDTQALCGSRDDDVHGPAICLRGPDRGTVSATLLLWGEIPETRWAWSAAGPPDVTPWRDHAEEIREFNHE